MSAGNNILGVMGNLSVRHTTFYCKHWMHTMEVVTIGSIVFLYNGKQLCPAH